MHIVQLAALGHSGTTIVDRILSCFPGVIGLGEVEQAWRRAHRGTYAGSQCPCGQTVEKCPYWSKVYDRPLATEAEFFARIASRAGEMGQRFMVDSSKGLMGASHYGKLLDAGQIEGLWYLRQFRDPRGWVHSLMKRTEVGPDDTHQIRGLFFRWLISNVRFDRRVLRPGASSLYIWYDRLVLRREENVLAGLLGLEASAGSQIDLAAANQHALAGNQLRNTHERRSNLSWDPSWLENPVLDEIYCELPSVRAYYHELQKVHLKPGARVVAEPPVRATRVELAEAVEQGDFTDLEKLLTGTEFAMVSD
jgi:hypothetical protein